MWMAASAGSAHAGEVAFVTGAAFVIGHALVVDGGQTVGPF